jgi:hypothetical protein
MPDDNTLLRRLLGITRSSDPNAIWTQAENNVLLRRLVAAFQAASSGGGAGAAWGAITGTLSNQTDLQTALNGKRPIINASAYGAVGNDSTDDTSALQAAIAAAQAARLPLYIPQGTYKITSALVITLPIEIIGAGCQENGIRTIIKQYTNGAHGITRSQSVMVTIGDIKLSGFKVLGPGAASTGYGLNWAAASYAGYGNTFERIWVEGFARGFSGVSTVQSVFSQCYFLGNLTYGVYLEACDSQLFISCATGGYGGLGASGRCFQSIGGNKLVVDGGEHGNCADFLYAENGSVSIRNGNFESLTGSVLCTVTGAGSFNFQGMNFRLVAGNANATIIRSTAQAMTTAIDISKSDFTSSILAEWDGTGRLRATGTPTEAGANIRMINGGGTTLREGTQTQLTARDIVGAYKDSLVWLRDEFIGGSTSSMNIGQLGWGFANLAGLGSIAFVAGENGRPGIRRLSTGPLANDTACMFLQDTQSPFSDLHDDDGWEYTLIFRLNRTTNASIFFGLASNASLAASQYVGIKYDSAVDTTWRYVSTDSITPVNTNSGVAVGTGWIKFRVRLRTSSKIQYSINDAAFQEVTGPAMYGVCNFFIVTRTLTGSALTLDLDLFEFAQILPVGR